MKLRKNDLVKITAGDYKGKTGKILRIFPKTQRLTIEGITPIKRHVKPNRLNNQPGGTREVERTIHLSNVALVHPTDSAKTTRIGFTFRKDGVKVRVARQANNKELA